MPINFPTYNIKSCYLIIINKKAACPDKHAALKSHFNNLKK